MIPADARSDSAPAGDTTDVLLQMEGTDAAAETVMATGPGGQYFWGSGCGPAHILGESWGRFLKSPEWKEKLSALPAEMREHADRRKQEP